MPLDITTEGALLRFSGDTFNYKHLIKALPGARWNPAEKVWTAPVDSDLTAIKARQEELRPSDESHAYWAKRNAYLRKPREEWTKEEWLTYRLDWNKRGSPGKCCSHAVSFEQCEQGPVCWRCERHGETISNYWGN
jgi:hypothetical protein